MKITEIQPFKTIAGTLEKQKQLIDLFVKKGGLCLTPSNDINYGSLFCIHRSIKNDRMLISNYANLVDFENCDLPYMSFKGTIELFESLEDHQTGKFVEFDIDSDGRYQIPNTAILSWQDYMTYEHGNKRIFGGWLWSHNGKEFWRGRCGLNGSGKIVNDCDKWVKPLVPKKIRFWVEE
ncbi:MAG: hypothetical protein CVT92_02280 [Bacteroidetes bacterium HGW-Bacteroidetes-1]|jgi:hypothetical protein|nr:MAG: hypothetical protein CVT92_02280 [Bacteroidetes bacterium HGW-Bacteroidetes-1]